jgi:hypothetical protein
MRREMRAQRTFRTARRANEGSAGNKTAQYRGQTSHTARARAHLSTRMNSAAGGTAAPIAHATCPPIDSPCTASGVAPARRGPRATSAPHAFEAATRTRKPSIKTRRRPLLHTRGAHPARRGSGVRRQRRRPRARSARARRGTKRSRCARYMCTTPERALARGCIGGSRTSTGERAGTHRIQNPPVM